MEEEAGAAEAALDPPDTSFNGEAIGFKIGEPFFLPGLLFLHLAGTAELAARPASMSSSLLPPLASSRLLFHKYLAYTQLPMPSPMITPEAKPMTHFSAIGDSSSVGANVGTDVGAAVGATVGLDDGAVGTDVGAAEGDTEGVAVSFTRAVSFFHAE